VTAGHESRQGDRDRPPLVDLDLEAPLWDRFFLVAPLVLVGSLDADGNVDLAPKHMVTPLGWNHFFGFVCSPKHATASNIARCGEFTVSYPRPSQIVFSSLAASRRWEDGSKPVLETFETRPARVVGGAVIDGAYLYFECRHRQTVDGFGDNCLIIGEIVAAYADPSYLRTSDEDDQDLLRRSPLFAYLSPGRFAEISDSNAFPFPADMKK